MKIDLCALTGDVLPLFEEDLISPETRRLVEEHAATCQRCAEQFRSAREGLRMPLVSVPQELEKHGLVPPARRFFGRLRRLLFYALIGVVILLVTAGSVGYQFGRKSESERALIPRQVASADDLARLAVPGWSRAAEEGLVVPLGITERVPDTHATITLEKAWYSGNEIYVLYTIKAPKGEYVLPTWSFLGDGDRPSQGGTNWTHLNQWGGFSRDGFHSVMVFPQFSRAPVGDRLSLSIRLWAPVSPRTGMDQSGHIGSGISISLPWQAEYLKVPPPEVYTLNEHHSWLGRTLTLEQVQVGAGAIKLTGWLELPPGESNPGLGARLLVDGEVREMKAFKAEPGPAPNRYRFTAEFDGPNQWPTPLRLELSGIDFETNQTLIWPVNWAQYGQMKPADRRLMDLKDQVTVRFYDSSLTSIFLYQNGMGIEQKDPMGQPPYVKASFGGGGRGIGPDHPGMELVNASGQVLTNMGGGGGVIWDDPAKHDQRQGINTSWGETFSENFSPSDHMQLRHIRPSATMVLKEIWPLSMVGK